MLRGDPGVGKTTLLEYAAGRATGMRVLRTRGVQAETRLSFAGLHAALRPLLHDLAALPAPQAAALAGALGLAEAHEENRFLVAAGVLGLLGEQAERQPVLCLVDDAQWLDGPSLAGLLFAARRIEADRIAMIFTVRPGEAELAGLRELTLGPVDPGAARALLLERAGAALDEAARGRVLAVAAGNPLALVELSAELTASAGDPAADPARLPLSARLEGAFLRRVREQSRDVQRILLLAAADDSGDPAVLLAAAETLGVDRAALAAAERAGLLRVDPTAVDFAHPLVRSAVYQTAPFTDRQDVHRALADVLAGEQDSGRRAWHRAAAAVFPAEDLVAELERAADQARKRAGHQVAAAALERAAALTADPGRRAGLLLDAAEAAWEGGAPDVASALVDQAGRLASGPLLRGRVDQLRGRIEARRGVVLDGYEILMDGAARIADLDPARAAAMLVDALQAASYGGDMARVVAAGRRAHLLPGGPDGSPAVAFVAGIGAALGGDAAHAVPLLRSVIARSEGCDDPLLLSWAGTACGYLGDVETARRYAIRAVTRARATGALSTLAYALELLGVTELPRRPAATEADATEGLRVARTTDQPASAAVHLGLLAAVAALRGDEQATVTYTDEVAELATKHGLGFPQARATWALAALDLGLGRPDHALARLEALAVSGHPNVVLASTPDLLEAAVRVGRRDRALAALAAFEAWATSAGTPWTSAMLARCRALLATGEAAVAYFQESLARELADGPSLNSARTQLLLGEFLRRERRRIDARPYLREALERPSSGWAPCPGRSGPGRSCGRAARPCATVPRTPPAL